jgi:ROK family
MGNIPQHNHVAELTSNPIPGLIEAQLKIIAEGDIHKDAISNFNVAAAVQTLQSKENCKVLGADFGGDKGSIRLFEVKDGRLVVADGYEDDIQGNDGFGYVDHIERAAKYAEANNIPFGISWGGPMNGSRLIYHPKAAIFMAEMEERYSSDLKNISPSITACMNDGPAGLVQGAVEAYRKLQTDTVLLAINGGGLGIGVLHDGVIYATEAGHAEGVADLNTYNQTSECGVFDATHTCIEQLGANKAGIETQWEAHTGSHMRARDIEDRYKEGDMFAAELYDHSALVVAHMIAGTADSFKISLQDSRVAVVCHGGAFKFPHYGERVQQILGNHVSGSTQLLMTKDFTDTRSNACLDGAAIAALVA